MGTQIAVMRKGVLQQQGSPQLLYDRPANLFVASFLGSPPMNLLRARIDDDEGHVACTLDGGGRLRLPHDVVGRHGLGAYRGRKVAVGIRPDYLVHAEAANGAHPVLEGQVRLTEVLGAEQFIHLDVDAETVVTDEVLEVASDTDAAVLHDLARTVAAHRTSIVARISAETPVAVGSTTRLAVPPERLHFFDLESGGALG